MPRNDEMPKGDQGVVRKVGNPYKVAGVWYYPKEDPYYDEVGYASWYGKDFHGKKTGNGEIYNMNALTAAHKTLPMPTFVKVTNLENNRTIILRVNDRGPFVAGRIIDISRRGAQLLGFHKQGLTRVRIQATDEKGNVRPAPKGYNQTTQAQPAPVVTAPVTRSEQALPTLEEETHYVQVGSFSSQDNANIQATKLRKSGHPARVVHLMQNGKAFWRVRVGPYDKRLIAEERLDRVVADGFYEARIFTERGD
jgi:rare lipoprotein A